jgi:SCP-2 sterol transfer family protein
VRCRWELHGAVIDTHDIVVEYGRCRMEPAIASAAQVTFRGEVETFVLLLYQRLPLTVATATGGLVIEGDGQLTAAFERWLQGG